MVGIVAQELAQAATEIPFLSPCTMSKHTLFVHNMEWLLVGNDPRKMKIKTFARLSHFLKCSLLVFQPFLSKSLSHRKTWLPNWGAFLRIAPDVVLPPHWNLGGCSQTSLKFIRYP